MISQLGFPLTINAQTFWSQVDLTVCLFPLNTETGICEDGYVMPSWFTSVEAKTTTEAGCQKSQINKANRQWHFFRLFISKPLPNDRSSPSFRYKLLFVLTGPVGLSFFGSIPSAGLSVSQLVSVCYCCCHSCSVQTLNSPQPCAIRWCNKANNRARYETTDFFFFFISSWNQIGLP